MHKPFRLLITGFEPFAGDSLNPSQQIIQQIDWNSLEAIDAYPLILPVSASSVAEPLIGALDRVQPDLAIHLGLAGGSSHIRLERVAINVLDMRIKDNSGAKVQDQLIVNEGPDAFFTTLPYRKMLNRLIEAKIPAEISNSAGTFICNQVMYLSLHYGTQHGFPRFAGFVHLPCLPEQAIKRPGMASMELQMMIRATRVMIHTCVNELEGSLK